MHITKVRAFNEAPEGLNLLEKIDWKVANPVYLRKSLTVEGDTVVADSFEVTKRLSWEPMEVTLAQLKYMIDEGLQAITLGSRKGKFAIAERNADDFEKLPQDVISYDVDGMPLLPGFTREDLLSDPERVVRAHVKKLIGENDLEWLVVLSSSCGFHSKGRPVLRFHLHIQLDRAYAWDFLAEIIKETKKKLPYIDPVTTTPSQYLLTCRPKMNVSDPFEQFTFYNKSDYHIIFDDGKEHYVPAELPTMRGTSSTLYQIKKDLWQSKQFVSDQMKVFTMSLRNRFPDMQWDPTDTCSGARAHVEKAMIKAGSEEYHWERLSNEGKRRERDGRWSLSVARRLFENAPIKGTKSIRAEPAYEEPEETANSAYRRLEKLVSTDMEGKHLFVVPTGTGKTEMITQFAIRNPHANFVILTTNHERCEELRGRLESARDAEVSKIELWDWPGAEERRHNALFRQWSVWQGRARLCQRPEDLERVQRAHLNVGENLCGTCPLADTCGYPRQVQTSWAYNWITPVAMVGKNVRIIKEADVVIIDEGVIGYLIGGKKFDISQLMLDRGDRLNELSRQTWLDLAKRTRSLSREECEEALQLERDRHPDVFAEGTMTSEEIEKSTCMDGYYPELVSLWRALIAEHDGAQNAIHIFETVEKDSKGQEHVRIFCRTAYRRSAALDDKTVLLFDATPNEVALKAHFPEIEIHKLKARVDNCHVVQVVNNRGGKSEYLNTLRAPTEKDDAKYHRKFAGMEKRKKKKRDEWAKWLAVQPGRTVVICKKELREIMEREYDLPRIAWGHLGGIEGKDVWQIEGLDVKGAEIDNLVIVGRNLPPPWQIEDLTRQHHFDEKEVQAINGEDGRMPWYGEDYKEIIAGTAGVRPVHPDPRADAVAQSIWKHTLEQAFGRGRGTRREKRLRVFITHNMPLDVTVHEAVSAAELDARVGDVTLLSPKEIERVFGISGRKFERLQIKPTHKYRMPGQAKGKGYACRVADGADVAEVMTAIGAEKWRAVE